MSECSALMVNVSDPSPTNPVLDGAVDEDGVIQESSKVFMKQSFIIDIDFLDRDMVFHTLAACAYELGASLYEWNTGWDWSQEARKFNSHLIGRGVPANTTVVLKVD